MTQIPYLHDEAIYISSSCAYGQSISFKLCFQWYTTVSHLLTYKYLYADGVHCLQNEFWCDGRQYRYNSYYGCMDYSDEGANCVHWECLSDYWKCADDLKCILVKDVCDNVKQCEDGSDEHNLICGCPEKNGWPCQDGDKCVSEIDVCDGYKDCNDISDEDSNICKNWTCPDTMWTCDDPAGYVKCVHAAFLCDDDADCFDESDEDINFCLQYSCVPGYEKCANGLQCIKEMYVCDGKYHCRDASDELCDSSCLKIPLGEKKSIIKKCKEYPEVCVPIEYHCDGVAHCPDASDEAQSGCTCEDWGFTSCENDGNTYCLNHNWLESNAFNESIETCHTLPNRTENKTMGTMKHNTGLKLFGYIFYSFFACNFCTGSLRPSKLLPVREVLRHGA